MNGNIIANKISKLKALIFFFCILIIGKFLFFDITFKRGILIVLFLFLGISTFKERIEENISDNLKFFTNFIFFWSTLFFAVIFLEKSLKNETTKIKIIANINIGKVGEELIPNIAAKNLNKIVEENDNR